MDNAGGIQSSAMIERYMRRSDGRRNSIYCRESCNFLQMFSISRSWTEMKLFMRTEMKTYLCTFGYFISEITLVPSVWLCFRLEGHMLSTQSTWSTCDQNCTFSHQSVLSIKLPVHMENHSIIERVSSDNTTVGRLMRFSSLVWLNSKLMTLKSFSRSSSGVS